MEYSIAVVNRRNKVLFVIYRRCKLIHSSDQTWFIKRNQRN